MTLKEVENLINKSKKAGFGFLDSDGNPSIREVFSTWHKGVGSHLISTNTSSMHVQCLLKNQKACMYFHNRWYQGVCLTGTATVHFEKEYKEMLWHKGDEQYYPNGVEDEDYCIIEFVADSARTYKQYKKDDYIKKDIMEYDAEAEYKEY